jgi:uncharacterized protein
MSPPNIRSDHDAQRPQWMQDLGLRLGWVWLADPRFVLALLAGLLFWLALFWMARGGLVETGPAPGLAVLVSLVLLQPLVEELLFRGLLQGRLLMRGWGRRQLGGFTLANLAASLLFAALHFASHPPLWAAGVLLPSLLYGYFRDRYDSVLPAIALHVFYNAGYFLLSHI